MTPSLTWEQILELQGFDGPTICNALEVFNIRSRTSGFTKPGLELRTTGLDKPLVGYAVTATVSALAPNADASRNLLGYFASIRNAAGPVIAVIQDIDPEPIGSFWGEVQATTHLALGAIGAVTEGGVRDIREAEALGFPFYSTTVLISHGYVHVEAFGCPVEVAGLSVHPGDLLFVDRYGMVQIPPDVAPRLADACRAVAAAELPMLEPCREAIRSGHRPSDADLAAWRGGMEQARKDICV